jgi:hypothetical protein
MKSYVTIVSGLPRSGTSMMMRMLKSGGMDVVTDNIRQGDEDNPHGYYEYEKVKSIQDNASWLEDMQGKVFKMVSMLLFHLPPDTNYRLVFMKRNLKEVISSQSRMLIRTGKDTELENADEMEILYTKHLREVEEWVERQPNIEVLYLDYLDVLEKTLETAGLISDFLGSRLSINDMCSAVDKTLYRNRTSEKVEATDNSAGESTDSEKEEIKKKLALLGYM